MREKTVLIIEDDVDMGDYLELMLTDLGVNLLRATDGREALDIIDSRDEINLILLDVIMPVMDGEEFLRELRVERKMSIPVILSSVDKNIADRLKGIGKTQGVFLKGGHGDDLKKIVMANLK